MLNTNVIPFLTDLANNNNKAWFEQNKPRYKQAFDDFKEFIDQLIPHLANIDPLLNGLTAKDCVYRIYRDVRFSKDKTPYKTHFGAYMAPGGRKSKLAGFYVHIDPSSSSMTGGGIYHPEAPELKAIRTEFHSVPEDLIEILDSKNVKNYFSGLWENKLKMAPKGFPKEFEHIDLLKYKSYILSHNINNSTIKKDDFILYLVDVFKALYPLNRLLNTILEDAKMDK